MLLVPADVLHPRRPDEHFAAEAAAARDAGLHGLPGRPRRVDPPGRGAARRRPGIRRPTRRSTGAGCSAPSRTPPSPTRWPRAGSPCAPTPSSTAGRTNYPGWYAALKPCDAGHATWTVGDGRDAFDRARTRAVDGPAVLRDYCKSMKHHWDEAAFISDLADAEAAWSVASPVPPAPRGRAPRRGGLAPRRFERFTSGWRCAPGGGTAGRRAGRPAPGHPGPAPGSSTPP